jgi:hypothetical protein
LIDPKFGVVDMVRVVCLLYDLADCYRLIVPKLGVVVMVFVRLYDLADCYLFLLDW